MGAELVERSPAAAGAFERADAALGFPLSQADPRRGRRKSWT